MSGEGSNQLFGTVCLIGVGLEGGSLALNIRRHGLARKVVGVARRAETIQRIRELGLTDEVTDDVRAAAAEADLVVFCTPIGAYAELADAEFAAGLHLELRQAVERYEELKRAEGALDFLDLLIRARDLVRDQDAVRAELQRRLRVFFVDEVQDTDPLQAELLLLRDPSHRLVECLRQMAEAHGAEQDNAVHLPLPIDQLASSVMLSVAIQR